MGETRNPTGSGSPIAGGFDQLFKKPGAGSGGGVFGQLFGPGGSPITDQLGKTDPWYVFHKKDKVDYKPVDVEGTYQKLGGFQSAMGSNNQLDPSYTMDAPKTLSSQLDESGIAALKGKVIDPKTGKAITGPSAWAQMATQQQQLDETNQLNNAARAGAGQQAGARSMLAMRGGLRGGAAERLAAGGAEANLMAQQDIRNQGAGNRLNIGMQDETSKNQLLGNLIGAQQSVAGYKSGLDQQNIANKMGQQQFNIQNVLGQIGEKNKYISGLVGQKMAATGAAQTASATENAGKK